MTEDPNAESQPRDEQDYDDTWKIGDETMRLRSDAETKSEEPTR